MRIVNKLGLIKKILIIFVLFFIVFFISKKIHNNSSTYNTNNDIQRLLSNTNGSIYNIKNLNIVDFKGKPILLNIYDIKDFSYINSLDIANSLGKYYKNKLAIVDIIIDGNKFDKNLIINYIIKNNIERPTITLTREDLNNILESTENNAFIFADNKGKINDIFYSDRINEKTIIEKIDSIFSVKKLNNDEIFNLSLEKEKFPESFIKSLTYIKYLRSVNGSNDGPYFIISDGEGKKVYFVKLNGEITKQLGNGLSGNIDGVSNNSTFCYPAGIEISDDKNTMYVADMCNNSIREVNLKTLKTSTILKDEILLQKPMDLQILSNGLIISTLEKNLLYYDFKNKSLKKLDCENCSLMLPKLVKYDNKVYFLSKDNDSVYSINNELKFENYKKIENLEKYEINNFNIDETGVYFVDKYNNKVLKLDSNNKIIEYNTNKNGDYNLPSDIIDLKDKLYITNEGDKKIIELDKNTKNVNELPLEFGYEYNKLKISEGEDLDINNVEEVNIKSSQSENKLLLNLKDEYKFEEMAPQSISIYKEDKENNSAILVKSYSKNEILDNKELTLPIFENDEIYYIKGTFYYCSKNGKTPCLINSFFKKIISNESEKNTDINIDFLY